MSCKKLLIHFCSQLRKLSIYALIWSIAFTLPLSIIRIAYLQVWNAESTHSTFSIGPPLVCGAYFVESVNASRRVYSCRTVARITECFRQINRLLLSLRNQRWANWIGIRRRQFVRTNTHVRIAFAEEWSAWPWKAFDTILYIVQHVCWLGFATEEPIAEGMCSYCVNSLIKMMHSNNTAYLLICGCIPAERSRHLHASGIRRGPRTTNQAPIPGIMQIASGRVAIGALQQYHIQMSEFRWGQDNIAEYVRRRQPRYIDTSVQRGIRLFVREKCVSIINTFCEFHSLIYLLSIHSFIHLQLHKETYRGHSCGRRWAEIVAILQLGESALLTQRPHGTVVAMWICVLARHATSYRNVTEHSVDGGFLAESSHSQRIAWCGWWTWRFTGDDSTHQNALSETGLPNH